MPRTSRRQILRQATQPFGRAAKELGSLPESNPSSDRQKRYHQWLRITRRTVLTAATLGTGAYALQVKTGIFTPLYRSFLDHFIAPHVEGPIARDLTDQFLNHVPTPEKLLEDFPQGVLNREIKIAPEKVQDVHWYVFGDSMNLVHGKRAHGAEFDPLGQVGSYPYEMAKRVNDVNGWNWEGRNYAIPGAESGDGTKIDGTIDEVGSRDNLLGTRQLGNQDVRNALVNDPSMVNIVISLNGNDWREIVPSQEKVTMYMDLLQHPEKLDQSKIDEIRSIIDQHNKVTNTFGQNILRALDILADINAQRIASGNKPPLEVTFVLPINNRIVRHVPFQPKDSPTTTSGGYFVGNRDHPEEEPTDLQKVLYHITMSIIGETADAIESHRDKYKDKALSFHAISKFGLEETGLYIDEDGTSEGHLNQNGQYEVGDRLFEIIRDESTGLTLNQEPGIILDYPGRELTPGLRRSPR